MKQNIRILVPANLSYDIIEGNKNKSHTMVILHGLFCSKKTFRTFIQESDVLSSIKNGVLLDLRNHGDSEKRDTMNYDEMADDVINCLNKLNLRENIILLGHSIGGKNAMQLSITKPNMFSHVIVVDVAPVDMNLYKDKFPFIPFMTRLINDLIFLNYNKDYNYIFQRILALCNPENYNLAVAICENLEKIDETHYKMRLDLETILKNYFILVGNISFKDSYQRFKGKVRIICGKDSNGVQPDFFSSFDSVFEDTQDIIEFIPNSKHWVHLDQPDLFRQSVCEFINN
jgi:pimeloyl-ACP methyl ester carboxylesterase